MAANMNEKIKEFAGFIAWAEKMRSLDHELWRKPITEGKWSIREILTHIMFWDRNLLEKIVPNVTEGAELFFVDIDSLNQEASLFSQSYTKPDALIDDAVNTRKQLLLLLNECYDDTTQFRIDHGQYTFEKLLDEFIEHDEHHIKQVESFLAQPKSL
ncbi:DinB family protein [Paenibacillus beijingensis]|uniref:DinB-like domain-containing protein n=1 Tax=Paenibacillus beijingensis TaxID=1126833 RepID=A0A0D5NEX6_9BACL|nr:DinB family protein [Paenibacillus beijingensis]AJY73473.1 hypothetical protein VN24_01085 [Paenibacillus beijingensis]